MRLAAGAGLLAATAQVAALPPSCTDQIRMASASTQGALLIGHAPAGTRYVLGSREQRVMADGIVAVGLPRDAPPVVTIQVQCDDGSKGELTIAVTQRSYAIERVDGVPQQTVHPSPAVAERIAREQAQVAAARQRDDARSDLLGPFKTPVAGRISGTYGSQRVLNGTPKDPHYGLDIAAPTGTGVHAPAPGVVSFAERDLVLTGGTVVLDHGHGVSSVFLHLSRLDVHVGQQLHQGERIGAVGQTGRASGPHLHWGLNWFDVRLDPQLLLAKR